MSECCFLAVSSVLHCVFTLSWLIPHGFLLVNLGLFLVDLVNPSSSSNFYFVFLVLFLVVVLVICG